MWPSTARTSSCSPRTTAGNPPCCITAPAAAGLVTYHAAADFDEVLVNAAGATSLLSKRFVPDADISARRVGREFSRIGGDWQYVEPVPGFLEGYQQRDPSRSAFSYVGTQVRNQEIDVSVKVDAVSSLSATTAAPRSASG